MIRRRPTRKEAEQDRIATAPVNDGSGGYYPPESMPQKQHPKPRISETEMIQPLVKRGIAFGPDKLKGFAGNISDKLREMKRIELHLDNADFVRKLKLRIDSNGGFYRKGDYLKALQGTTSSQMAADKSEPETQPEEGPTQEPATTTAPATGPVQTQDPVAGQTATDTFLGMKKAHAWMVAAALVALVVTAIVIN